MRTTPIVIAAAFGVTAGAAGFSLYSSATQQDDRVREVVERHLVSHPEIVLQALQNLERRRAESAAAPQQQALDSNLDELFGDPLAPVGGNPNGDVAMVEFFDYNCPYCRAVGATVRQLLEQDPGIRYIYKEFPILTPSSRTAARAALAAAREGMDYYHRFHDALMSAQGRLVDDDIYRIAETSGLDIARLESHMQAPEIDSAIERNIALASRLGIRGTPTFVIGDRVIAGAASLEALQQAINQARSKN